MSNSILNIKIVAQVLRSNVLLTYSAEEIEPELFVHRGIFFIEHQRNKVIQMAKKTFLWSHLKNTRTPLLAHILINKNLGEHGDNEKETLNTTAMHL